MDEVQSQYERYPYPPRDPADERRRLAGTVLDSLALINFYGDQVPMRPRARTASA